MPELHPRVLFCHKQQLSDSEPFIYWVTIVLERSPAKLVAHNYAQSHASINQNDMNPTLVHNGASYYDASLSMASKGGFYTSFDFRLTCSVSCQTNIILGADWLSRCWPPLYSGDIP